MRQSLRFLGKCGAVFALLLMPLGARAQVVSKHVVEKNVSTDVQYQSFQVRMCDVTSYSEFKPLVAEMEIIGTECVRKTYEFTTSQLVTWNGKLENAENYAVFQMAEELNADVIVGSTFVTEYDSKKGKGSVRVSGFPAKFKNWRTMSNDDLDWIVKLKEANKSK